MTFLAWLVILSAILAVVAPSVGVMFMDVSDWSYLGIAIGKVALVVFVASVLLLVVGVLGVRVSVQ